MAAANELAAPLVLQLCFGDRCKCLTFFSEWQGLPWLHLVAIKVGGFETGAWLQAFGTARNAWQLHRQSLNGG